MAFLSLAERILLASWSVLLDAAPWVLFGFFMAGLLKAFVPDDLVARHLGGRGFASILKASAIGVPIPLCSCGVLPAAAGLKKQGAGKGAVASFLISTPETGIDSIAVSYALLDPVMTVVRPIAGFITAVSAGLAVSASERFSGTEPQQEPPAASGSCSCGCDHGHGHEHPVVVSFAGKLRGGMSFAFGELLQDVGGWLLFGVLMAGTISTVVSADVVEKYLADEWLSMALMLAVSVPLYVCATASTPIAAAFAIKGISPGAALVFLLAGPATNAASISVIAKMLGKRATAIYLAAIIISSLVAGVLVNYLYGLLGLDIRHWIVRSTEAEPGLPAFLAVLLLALLLLRSYLPRLAWHRRPHHH